MSGQGRRVLVTGASGLIGRHAVAALAAQGFTVLPVRQASTDLLDPAARIALVKTARADTLLHLAWETEHGAFWHSPRNEAWLGASIDLVDRFLDQGGQRVVVAGTCAEYDWNALPDRVPENHRIAPFTAYGLAKNYLYEYIYNLNTSFAWGRVFLLYGAGEDPRRLVPSVAGALVRGEPALCSSGIQIRDFMDTRDVGAAFAALVASASQGAINVGTGIGHPVAEVAAVLGGLAGRPDLIRLGALPDRPSEPPRLVADTTRLQLQVGFHPKISLTQGLADAFAAIPR